MGDGQFNRRLFNCHNAIGFKKINSRYATGGSETVTFIKGPSR